MNGPKEVTLQQQSTFSTHVVVVKCRSPIKGPGSLQKQLTLGLEPLGVPERQKGRRRDVSRGWGTGRKGAFQKDTGANRKEFISPSVKMENYQTEDTKET